MKKIIIEAKVGNVYAPKKINVFINNLQSDRDDLYFESQKSFRQTFEVAPGDYVINVVGMNQDSDTTSVSIGGDFILPDTKSSSKPNYVMVFIGEVK